MTPNTNGSLSQQQQQQLAANSSSSSSSTSVSVLAGSQSQQSNTSSSSPVSNSSPHGGGGSSSANTSSSSSSNQTTASPSSSSTNNAYSPIPAPSALIYSTTGQTGSGTAVATANQQPIMLTLPSGQQVIANPGQPDQLVCASPSLYLAIQGQAQAQAAAAAAAMAASGRPDPAKKPKLQRSQPSKVVHVRNIPQQITEVEVIQFGLIFGNICNVLNLRSKCQVM